MPNATHDIVKLSGSAAGEPVLVASTGPAGTAGTLIHTVPAGKKDRLELWAWSTGASATTLTLQLGTTSAARELTVSIPPKGSPPQLVIPYLQFEAGTEIRAYAGTANLVSLGGHVNQRTPAA